MHQLAQQHILLAAFTSLWCTFESYTCPIYTGLKVRNKVCQSRHGPNFTTRKTCHAMCHIWNLGERWHQLSSRSQNWNLFKPNVYSCHCQTALLFLWATTYSSPSCGRLSLTFCIYWVTLQPIWAWEWHMPRFTTSPIHHVKQHFNMLKTCDLAQLPQA